MGAARPSESARGEGPGQRPGKATRPVVVGGGHSELQPHIRPHHRPWGTHGLNTELKHYSRITGNGSNMQKPDILKVKRTPHTQKVLDPKYVKNAYNL